MHRVSTAGLIFTLLLSLSFVTVFSTAANASSIEKVKGAMAIVAFDGGENPATGDKFFAMENGKKKAILEVVQFKKGKAKVKVLKGNAKEGMTVAIARKGKGAVAKGEDEGSGDASEAAETPKEAKKRARSAGAATLFKDMTIGAVVGYAMDSQTVTQQGVAVPMTGSGFSAKAFADVPVVGHLGLMGRAGVEQFNVTGGTSKSEIMYAAADLLLKYAFSESSFVPFVMGGLGLHFPISKSSTILDINKVSSTTVFYGGGGFNYIMGPSSYFQLTGEYGMFPPSNDVTTSFIAVRGGMGFRF